MKRRADAALAVPTNDKAVRARLRRLGEPMTLFGESKMETSDRLRMLMAKLDFEGQLERDNEAGAEEEIEYPFYTEGPKALQEARVENAKYSIVKAALRIHGAKRKRDEPDEDLDAEIHYSLKQARSLVLDKSEIGDDRPLSADGKMLATCSLTGVAKLWSMPQLTRLWNVEGSCLKTFRGHLDRLARIAFHPSGKYLGTTSFDKTLGDYGT